MDDQHHIQGSKSARFFRHILPIILSFFNAAIAIAIIGLAADSIAWAGGRGSEESNTVYAVVLGPAENGNGTYSDRWFTRMHYLPQYYDTQTFSAMVSAGAVCAIVGIVAGTLSIVSSRRKVRSLSLPQRSKRPHH